MIKKTKTKRYNAYFDSQYKIYSINDFNLKFLSFRFTCRD